MAISNFERMIQMAEEVFDVRHDPHQLQVDQEVIIKLNQLHPACVSELDEGEGPVIWLLLIPTTKSVMDDFISGKINESEILERTHQGERFESLYLCSAMVLPEYRNKGLAKKMALNAIHKMQIDHPLKYLYTWPFTEGGDKLAERISHSAGLPLMKRIKR